MSNRKIRFGVGIVWAIAVGLSASTGAEAQVANFGRSTDTIQVAGNTTMGAAATFEAVVLSYGLPGHVFNEWTNGQEDKFLSINDGIGFSGYTYPVNAPATLNSSVSITALSWHHVAFVRESLQERLYVDGIQVGARTATGNIGNGSGLPKVGAIFRDGAVHPSFRGLIDSLRISNVARYTGPSFAPPSGDMTSDGSTLILYNFNEPAASATIPDLSGNGHTGTLGVGFVGATSPTLGLSTVAAGQANSTAASLVIDGQGSGSATGPMPVPITSGGTVTLAWSGPPGMPIALAYGQLNTGGAIVPCLGSIDIGTPPGFLDVGILFDGSQPGFGFFFVLGTNGTATQSFSVPLLPPGILTTLQGLVFQPAGAPCPFVLTSAFLLQVI